MQIAIRKSNWSRPISNIPRDSRIKPRISKRAEHSLAPSTPQILMQTKVHGKPIRCTLKLFEIKTPLTPTRILYRPSDNLQTKTISKQQLLVQLMQLHNKSLAQMHLRVQRSHSTLRGVWPLPRIRVNLLTRSCPVWGMNRIVLRLVILIRGSQWQQMKPSKCLVHTYGT